MPATVTINGTSVTSREGESLFDCAERVGIRLPTSCNKRGKCRECMIEVVEGDQCLTPRTASEQHLNGSLRLACCARLAGDEGQVHCRTLKRSSIHVEIDAENTPHTVADTPLEPAVTRQGDTIYIEGEPVASSTGPIYGAAIDVGTTTVVLRVYDLESGEFVAGASFENPQRFGGSDVMARIAFDMQDKTRLLHRTLISHLSHCLEELPINVRDIYELVVAGNATMRDLFFGLNVESIGQKPYHSLTEHRMRNGEADSTVITSTAKRLRLPLHPAARIYGLPLISSHVGADTAACLMAIGLHEETKPVVLIDIGTNTEIVCGNKDRALAASCPAGPAFEGGAISCGMPGLDGAVEDVQIDEDGRVRIKVIGDAEPIGICGSGIVDALGAFLDRGIMDHFGRFTDGSERFYIDNEHNLYFTEGDISELAQAKGAIMAGLSIVLKTYGLTYEGIDRLYLAGGFARHIDIDAARQIGLVPNLPDSKIIKIGNAAVEGACIALKSLPIRRQVEAFVQTIEHVELETDPDFFDHFVEGCQFDVYHDKTMGV